MLVSKGSTALAAAAVVLPRYGGVNFARGINEVVKREGQGRRGRGADRREARTMRQRRG